MNKFIAFFAFGSFAILAIMAFTRADKQTNTRVTAGADLAIEIPEEVDAVLQNYCFGCHNTESRNEKGRDKLSIDMLGDLPTGKLAAKLNKMVEELEEEEMPPKQFLEKFPDKNPSKEDRKKVIKWAKSTAKKL